MGFDGHNRGICKKCGKFHKSVHHTEEAKRRIGNANRKNKGWCSGLTKETDERIRRISLKSGRYVRTDEHRRKLRERQLKYYSIHEHPNKGKRRTEEIKAKIRDSFAQTCKDPAIIDKYRQARLRQVFPRKDTQIEQMMARELNNRKIFFRAHAVVIDKYQTDFLINDRLIVECDGEYWHNYPYGLDKDHKRDSELSQQGYTTLRFWGKEIEKSVQICVDKMQKEMLLCAI